MLKDLLLEPTWQIALKKEFDQEYMQKLYLFIQSEYNQYKIYPDWENIFLALNLCPINKIKVVILGQDPYHNPDQATGLSFSVPNNSPMPPSLKNIFKEIKDDLDIDPYASGDLCRWAKQGVLLLNTTLTVRANQPNSHHNQGWEKFTNKVIQILSEKNQHIVFILWGNLAKTKRPIINIDHNLILESAHPSPFSAHKGFFGNKHFSQANNYLISNKIKPIDWR